jgi:regulator of PEP synthase PpsR (kinase-PPPase family)
MWNSKDVYYISDGTGILATNLGQALICQFPGIHFNEEKFSYIQSMKEAKEALAYILKRSGGRRPLIFSTIIDPKIRNSFNLPAVEFFDAFGHFLERLENCLEAKALREPGFSRHMDDLSMSKRVAAIHFCLEHDDGKKIDEFGESEIILLGVSRTGKTPICVFLATQIGLKSANFPLTTEYLSQYRMPDGILHNLNRVIGLTTAAELLSSARGKRYPHSNYARLQICKEELYQAQRIFDNHKIPVVNTAGKSIEEIAAQIMRKLGISRQPWQSHHHADTTP